MRTAWWNESRERAREDAIAHKFSTRLATAVMKKRNSRMACVSLQVSGVFLNSCTTDSDRRVSDARERGVNSAMGSALWLQTCKILLDSGEDFLRWNLASIIKWSRLQIRFRREPTDLRV